MNSRIPMVLVALFSLAGCTPTAENTARRPDTGPARSESRQFAQVRQTIWLESAPLLDVSTREIIAEYGPIVRQCADRYGFDWRLVLAVMRQESGFNTDAESDRGACGLMQIMPVTEEEVARHLDLDSLEGPGDNIRGGVYYLSRLHGLFSGVPEPDRTKLALAAYNAGVSRVYDAQEVAAYFRDDPARWRSIRDALPLLSKRFDTLHRSIWSQDRPRNGWFGGSRQTVAYVESVMRYYEEYRLVLN